LPTRALSEDGARFLLPVFVRRTPHYAGQASLCLASSWLRQAKLEERSLVPPAGLEPARPQRQQILRVLLTLPAGKLE